MGIPSLALTRTRVHTHSHTRPRTHNDTHTVSFVFWYRNAYNGTRNNNSLQYVLFFFNYAIFIAASIIFALGLVGSGGW